VTLARIGKEFKVLSIFAYPKLDASNAQANNDLADFPKTLSGVQVEKLEPAEIDSVRS